MAESGTRNRSPELRKDTIQNRWVIFSPARARRPSDFKSKSNPVPSSQSECPFCAGHEHECAPEIFRVPADSGSDWKIRVIQNLYPAVSRDLHFQTVENASVHCGNVAVPGFGFHDVVIESPVHSDQLCDLSRAQIGEVLLAFRKRIEQLRSYASIQYVQVFKNHGASAGASMSHSHSQIMALPVVPPAVTARLNCMREYHEQTGNCSICDLQLDNLLIDESSQFIALAPFAATFPFEIWIIPRGHSSHFHQLTREKADDLGGLLKLVLSKMSLQLDNPPFNLMIHTSPLHSDHEISYSHWFLQIVPQLTGIGGFEMGTGCYINPVFPEDAAKLLREVRVTK